MLNKTVKIRRDKVIETTREAVEAFLNDFIPVKKDIQEDGSIVLYVRKKVKCKNCVSWVAFEGEISGACGDEDRDKMLRKQAAEIYRCDPDDPDLVVEAFTSADDRCLFYRSRRRKIGGHEVDERRSCFLFPVFEQFETRG